MFFVAIKVDLVGKNFEKFSVLSLVFIEYGFIKFDNFFLLVNFRSLIFFV